MKTVFAFSRLLHILARSHRVFSGGYLRGRPAGHHDATDEDRDEKHDAGAETISTLIGNTSTKYTQYTRLTSKSQGDTKSNKAIASAVKKFDQLIQREQEYIVSKI